ncbi:MAG: hypothetical protein IJH34_14480 [Romboutsia sp.]|nr:hypothetical protein [Romboutsia sp.]
MKINNKKIDVEFLKNEFFSKMNEAEYEKHIENLAYNSFSNLKKIMGINLLPIYLKFDEDQVVKTIYANCNEDRIEWSKAGLYNDILIIMNELSKRNVEITKSVFEQLILIAIAQEMSHLLDKEYKKFCHFEYETIIDLMSLYGTKHNLNRKCEEIIQKFKIQKINNEKRGWEMARKYLTQGKTKYVNSDLFDAVKNISIQRYKSLSWEQIYEIEFDCAKNILEEKYSSKTIEVVMNNIKSKDFKGYIDINKAPVNDNKKSIRNSIINLFSPLGLVKNLKN